MRNLICVFAALAAMSASVCAAQEMVALTGGQSTGTLDAGGLASVGLFFAGFSDEVTNNADGAGIFVVNGRDDPTRPDNF